MTSSAQSPSDPKSVVLGFFTTAFIERDPLTAADRYLGTTYTQHNPGIPDGPEVFRQFIPQWLSTVPELSFDIRRVITEGDLVVLHYHMKNSPDDLGTAIVDIFRVEDGRVVEHWDVLQPVPAEAANSNTMF
jgi:predicted SnoaL-like aldol condensation-catalyzing enzyme